MQEILASTSPIAGMSRHQNASTPVNDEQTRLKLPVIKSEMDPSSTIAFNQYSYPIGYEQNNFSVDSISKSDSAVVDKSQQMNSWKTNSNSLLTKTTSPVSSTSSATYENLADAAKKDAYSVEKEEANNAPNYAYSYANQFQRPLNMVQSSSSLIAALNSHPGSHHLQAAEAAQHPMSAANYNCQSALKNFHPNFYNTDLMNPASMFSGQTGPYSESSNGPSFMNHAGMIVTNGAVSHAFTNDFGYDMKTATGVRNLSPSNAASKLETNTNMYSSSSSSSAPSSSSSSFTSSPSDSSPLLAKLTTSNLRSDNSTSSSSGAATTTAATSSAGQGLNANFAMAPGSSSVKDEPMPATFGWMKPNKGLVNGKTRTKDKYRVVYTEPQRLQLEAEFLHGNYITIKRKNELSSVLNLSERQIKIWFQNRRAKERKKNRRVKLNGSNNVSSTTPSIKREDMYDGYDEDEDDDEDDETDEEEEAYMDEDDGQMSENKLEFAKREPSEAGEADKKASVKGGKDKKSTAKATSTTGNKKAKTSKPPSVTNNSNSSSNLNNSSSTDEHYSGENRAGNLFPHYNQNSLQFPTAYSTNDQLVKSGQAPADASTASQNTFAAFANLLPAQHHSITSAYTGTMGGVGGASSAASTSSTSSSSSSSSSSPTSTPLYSNLMPPNGGYPSYATASNYHQYITGCASMQQDPYGAAAAAAVSGNHYQNFHTQNHLNYYNPHAASSQALSAYSAQHQQQIASSSDYHGLQYQLEASPYTHFQAQPQSQVLPFHRTASSNGSEYMRESTAAASNGATGGGGNSTSIASSSPLLFANMLTSQY